MSNRHIASQDHPSTRSPHLALKNSRMPKRWSHVAFISWDTWHSSIKTCGTYFRKLWLCHLPIFRWHLSPLFLWHVNDMTLDFHIRSRDQPSERFLLRDKHRSLKCRSVKEPKMCGVHQLRRVALFYHGVWYFPIMIHGIHFKHIWVLHLYYSKWHVSPFFLWHVRDMTSGHHITPGV